MGIRTWASWGHHSVCHMGIRTWASWGHGPACPHLKDEGALRVCAHHTHVSIFTPGHREAFWVTLTPGRVPGTQPKGGRRPALPGPRPCVPEDRLDPGNKASVGKSRQRERTVVELPWPRCGALRRGGGGAGGGARAEQRAWPTHGPPSSVLRSHHVYHLGEATRGGEAPPSWFNFLLFGAFVIESPELTKAPRRGSKQGLT